MNLITEQRIAQRAGQPITRSPMVGAFVDTACVFGAFAWLYVAVIAVFTPAELSLPILAGIPIRRDTAAVICFGGSAVAYFVRAISKQSSASGDVSLRRTISRALLMTVFVYSTMVVIYLMASSITHPHTMTLPLIHLLDWPREGAVLAFALSCSVLSFFFLRVSAYVSKSSRGS